MILHVVKPQQFAQLAPAVHAAVFKEQPRQTYENRYNFALVVADDERMIAYSTIIEMDDETAYMQHGGASPEAKGTIKSKRAYALIIEWLKQKYKRISTRIQNTNVPMIKFALSEGLIVDGCFCYEREVFLSLSWGFRHDG